MKIIARFSRTRLMADAGHALDLMVRLRAPAPDEHAGRPPLAVVPVVDVSGSMAGGKLKSVITALERLIDHLVPGDHVGLVTFDSTVHTPLPVVEVSETKKAELRRIVRGLRAGSNTNMAGGLIEGLAALERAALPDAVRRRLILLTDGHANEGPVIEHSGIVGLSRDRAAKSISISAFGYGDDCEQALLGDIAEAGGGSYAYIQSEDVVLSAFARELGGLLATYAREVSVRVIPLGEGRSARSGIDSGVVDKRVDKADRADKTDQTISRKVRDLLFFDDVAIVVPVTIAVHGRATDVAVARVEVSFVDTRGQRALVQAEARVDFVPLGGEDRADDREVERLRDEALLREAQELAEARARSGDWKGARAAIAEVVKKLRDTGLLAFTEGELLASYGDPRQYQTRSSLRASSLAALRGTRMVTSERSVAKVYDIAPSAAEWAMESSFRDPASTVASPPPDSPPDIAPRPTAPDGPSKGPPQGRPQAPKGRPPGR